MRSRSQLVQLYQHAIPLTLLPPRKIRENQLSVLPKSIVLQSIPLREQTFNPIAVFCHSEVSWLLLNSTQTSWYRCSIYACWNYFQYLFCWLRWTTQLHISVPWVILDALESFLDVQYAIWICCYRISGIRRLWNNWGLQKIINKYT